MRDVTGFGAHALLPTGGDDLVRQLNEAARRQSWPWIGGGVAAAVVVTLAVWPLALLIAVVGVAVTVPVCVRERTRGRVEVNYDIQGPIGEWFAAVTNGWFTLMRLGGAWRIVTTGAVQTTYQHKTNAGAAAVVGRTRVGFTLASPKILVTNVAAPSFTAAGHSVFFLPDRVLVRSGRLWSDIAYESVRLASHHQRFIEDESPPVDGQQVGTTWQYVNVRGGPDRRFKNNRQLPVMLYGRLELTTGSGLQWVVDLSQPAVSDWLARLLNSRPTTQAA